MKRTKGCTKRTNICAVRTSWWRRALAVALTGVLAQGMLSPEMCGAHGDHTSHFFMAFDPAMFGDPADIRARMSGYLQALRDSEKAPGYARIYTPGEKAHEAQKDRLQNGIPVETNTLAELRRIAAELGIEGV